MAFLNVTSQSNTAAPDPRYIEIAVSESVNDGADQIYSESTETIRVVQAAERDTRVEITDAGQWYECRLWKRHVPVGDLDLTRPVYALYRSNRIIPRGMAGNATHEFVTFSNTQMGGEPASRVSGGGGTIFAATFDKGQDVLTYKFDPHTHTLTRKT